MKMKCCECEVEFLVRKEVAAKRFEKGITMENYVCRTCRPNAPKKVYVKKKKLPKRDSFGRFVKKVEKVTKTVVKKITLKKEPLRDAKGRFVKKVELTPDQEQASTEALVKQLLAI